MSWQVGKDWVRKEVDIESKSTNERLKCRFRKNKY